MTSTRRREFSLPSPTSPCPTAGPGLEVPRPKPLSAPLSCPSCAPGLTVAHERPLAPASAGVARSGLRLPRPPLFVSDASSSPARAHDCRRWDRRPQLGGRSARVPTPKPGACGRSAGGHRRGLPWGPVSLPGPRVRPQPPGSGSASARRCRGTFPTLRPPLSRKGDPLSPRAPKCPHVSSRPGGLQPAGGQGPAGPLPRETDPPRVARPGKGL